MPDIDIDFADRNKALGLFKHVKASRNDHGVPIAHNTGVYFHKTPIHAPTGLSAIDYEEAENFNYFKVDFLNVSMYKDIQSEEQLVRLMNQEPLWDLLEDEDFVNLLFHINGHADILKKTKPKNIEQLAAILAMIRPAKRYLIGKDWETILSEVWQKPKHAHEYYFKKSHATAYAVAVVVQMNLICEGISYGFS
jgi:DNA polymerase III alpha subunit